VLGFNWLYKNDAIINDYGLSAPIFTGIGHELRAYKYIKNIDNNYSLWTTGYGIKLPDNYYGIIYPPRSLDENKYDDYIPTTYIDKYNQDELFVVVDNSKTNNLYKTYILMTLLKR
jgi:dUTPase